MNKLVKHKVPYTVANGLRYDFDAKEMVACEFELLGKLSVERAQFRARRDEGDNTIVITDVEYGSRIYAMPVDEFMSNAEVWE